MTANLLAPISAGFNKNNFEIKKNTANAVYEDALVKASVKTTDKTIEVTVSVVWPSSLLPNLKQIVTVNLSDGNGLAMKTQEVPMTSSSSDDKIQMGKTTFNQAEIKENTPYQISTSAARSEIQLDIQNPINVVVSGIASPNPLTFKTQPAGTTTPVASGTQQTDMGENKDTMPACSMNPIPMGNKQGTFMGCVAQAFYYVFFVPTSYLFALAGTFFDYTFAYSVQDTSYRSSFVVEGWALVRDFCNMFFIFIMLYVAIGTILGLHSVKTKETIINVVIIGLFINFSLFATQVIIDASNITARVFYNSNAIKITEKGANGVASATPGLTVGEGGVIPLSAALVNKINPQNLIINSKKINDIPVKGGSGDAVVTSGIDVVEAEGNMGAGTFILIVIMAVAVNVVGIIVFLTVGFLFVARVIGLWLAMILAPLAFFTYILPEMAGTKMIGWKNWWPETLKLAFMAPIFIFFMYLILKFLQMDIVSDPINKTGLEFFIATIIPFVFVMILMIKAKKIAIGLSGEFGEIAAKAGGAIGGMAIGGGIGLGAMAMRGTLGKMGNTLAESKFAKTNGRLGRMLGDAGKWTAASSFDARKTKLGGMAGKGLGVDIAGKEIGMGVKEGGYAKYKTDLQKKREERAKSLEVGHDEHEMHDLHEKEEGLQALKNANATELTAIQGKIDAWSPDARDKKDRADTLEKELEKSEAAGTATDSQRIAARMAREKAISVAEALQAEKDKKDEIRNRTTDGVETHVSKKAVDVSKDEARIAEEEAVAARTNANEAQNTLTNIPAIEQAAITKAQTEEQAAITKAQTEEQAAIDKVESEAQEAVRKAKEDFDKATQASTTAFANIANNPAAYEKAKNDKSLAEATLATVQTKNSQAEVDIAINKIKAETQAVITKAQTDAATVITKAQTDAATATTKAQSNLAATEKIAEKKEKSATDKRTRATELETAHINKKKIARSMNDLEFQEIPEAKQVVSTISVGRKTEYAGELKDRWFNKKINAHARHNILMNAEIKSDGKVGH